MSSDSFKVPWRPWLGVIFGVFIFLAAQLVAIVVVSFYPSLRGWSHAHASDWLQNDLSAQAAYILLASSLTLGGIYAWIRPHADGFKALALSRPKRSDPAYGLAAFPVYYVILLMAVTLVKLLVPSLNIDQAQELGFDGSYGALQLILIGILLVGIAPLVEEITFRGLIYGSLKSASSVRAAAIITSLLFAAGHLAEGGSSGPLYIAAIDTFVLSLILIYLREKTGRLWASYTLHAAKNAIAFVYLFILHVH
jgi:membrane protease YdiL (CAAX protease family)